MSLSHVLMWTEEYGYRHVSESEAGKKYPETVSARSGIFICEICCQPVTFTSGDIRVRHFRHGSTAENKDCEDRSVQYGGMCQRSGFRRDLCALPLRLVQTSSLYRLELGLLALSEEQLEHYGGRTLHIKGQKTKAFSYDIAERLHSQQLTWLDVGSVPAKKYLLSLSGDFPLPPRWPRQVDGMADTTLFNAETGKQLPPFPDVEVDREYIVAILGNRNLVNYGDVSLKTIPLQRHGWNGWALYKVKALRFSKSAARFFLQFQATLTKSAPPRIFPLWPAFMRTPHLIYHNADEVFVFIEGEGANVHLFPAGSLLSDSGTGRARIIRFAAGTRKQMVTGMDAAQLLLEVGRKHMLRYDYFIRRQLSQTAPQPAVMIIDHSGSIISEDWMERIPRGGEIRIIARFDGEVWLERDNIRCDCRKLKGGEELKMKVTSGVVLNIFQGLDRVRSIVFARLGQKRSGAGNENDKWDDAMLCRRLRRLTGDEVPAVHQLAIALRFFHGYRATSAWLLSQKAEGRISVRALSLLQNLMGKS